MKIPKAVVRLIESFERLPGIGPKTAQRLTFYLLHVPQSELDDFSQNLARLKRETVVCSICKNIAETNPCHFCSDKTRDQETVMVVEQPLDILAIERTGKYKGLYHVLHGMINPLENIGPDELFIKELLARVKNGGTKEVILATNPTMEGEATAIYIAKQLKIQTSKIKITRLGVGVPTGADIEYADEVTLTQAIEGRRGY